MYTLIITLVMIGKGTQTIKIDSLQSFDSCVKLVKQKQVEYKDTAKVFYVCMIKF